MFSQANQPLSRVDPDHFVLQHLHIALPTHNGSQRGGNLVRRQQACSHLIQHWTKQVIVPLVD